MKHVIFVVFLFLTHQISAQISGGNSLAIQANGQYVNVNDPTSATISTNMTIEAWVYYCCSNGSVGANVVGKGWCLSQWGYYLEILNHQINFGWQRVGTGSNCNAFSGYSTTATNIPYNTWTHIAVVHTVTSITIYVNGVAVPGSLVAGTYGDITPTAEPMLIGGYHSAGSGIVDAMKGRIDDFRIWNTARSASEIAVNYQAELSGSETGLVAYYKMNETGTGANITAVNSATATSGSFNGTTVGGATSFQSNATSVVCYTGAPPAACAALPVMLEDFTANAEANDVKLRWSVATMDGMSDFEIERSEDGKNFITLGHLAAIDRQHDYNYTDRSASSAKYFYRLACREKNGSSSFSPVVRVNFTFSQAINIYPVPAKDELHISLPQNGIYSLMVSTIDGRTVITQVINSNNHLLNTAALPEGIYILNITNRDGYRCQQKFSVAH